MSFIIAGDTHGMIDINKIVKLESIREIYGEVWIAWQKIADGGGK